MTTNEDRNKAIEAVRAVKIGPFGPNTMAIIDRGGKTALTPAEAEQVIGVLESLGWSPGGVPAANREALAQWLYSRYRSWENLDVEWEQQPEEVREGRRRAADDLLASGILRSVSEVQAEALEAARWSSMESIPAGARFAVEQWLGSLARSIREETAQ